MKAVIVATSADTRYIYFTVISDYKEILYGKAFWISYDIEDQGFVSIEVWTFQRKSKSDYFSNIIDTDKAINVFPYIEKRQNEDIIKAVKKAIPDIEITEIINI